MFTSSICFPSIDHNFLNLVENEGILKLPGKAKYLLPGGLEPPTFALLQHQLGYCAGTAYKYDALTDCATGAG